MLYEWLQHDIGRVANKFINLAIPMGIALAILTWNPASGGCSKEDEMGKMILVKSTRISYYSLLTLIAIVVIIEKWVLGQNNVPLNLILCFGIAINPVVEWWIARKYI